MPYRGAGGGTINHMKKIIAVLACTFALWSCDTEFDGTGLGSGSFDNSVIDSILERLQRLESMCEQTNNNISSLQTILASIQNNDCIVSVVPVSENGTEIGYTIMFAKSSPITIYNGRNGADGYTPVVGVRQDADGVYYWTLDGDWLTDGGNKIRVNGTDGEPGAPGNDGKDGQPGADGKDGENGKNGADGRDGQNGADGKDGEPGAPGTDGKDGKDGRDGQNGADGKDGITPQLKIDGGYWFVSTDNGATWTNLGRATGENGKDGKDGENGKDGVDGKDGANGSDGKDGDSIFKEIRQASDMVYFVLSDGQVIAVPKFSVLDIEFENAEDIKIPSGRGTFEIEYTLIGADDKTDVAVVGQNGVYASVVRSGILSGRILVTVPSETVYGDHGVIVFVSDGRQKTVMRHIGFQRGSLTVSSGKVPVQSKGGFVDFIVRTDLDYSIEIPDQDKEWISLASTRASMHNDTVRLYVLENKYVKRSSTVAIRETRTNNQIGTVVIEQEQYNVSYISGRSGRCPSGATNLSVNETANCYIVQKAGTYRFNAKVMGNGKSTDRFVAVARELNPSAAGIVWSTVDLHENPAAISDFGYDPEAGCIYFTTDGTEQNTLIAAADEAGRILWSWHLWITDYDPEDELGHYNVLDTDNDKGLPGTWATPATWMSRNLGAMHEGNTGNYDDVQRSFGLLYQWGRKDPFPGGIVADWGTADNDYNWENSYWDKINQIGVSNDIIYYYDGIGNNASTSSEYYIKSQDVLFESVKDNVQFSVSNPSIYISNHNYPYWWISTKDCNTTHDVAPDDPHDGWGFLWGNCSDSPWDIGEKSIYDPCPAGWQVPCASMFRFVTSHNDAASVQWASVGIWRLNCKEAYDADIQNAIQVPTQAVNWWPDISQAKLKFPTFKGGFNFYIEDRGVPGESKGTITKSVDNDGNFLGDVEIDICGFESEPTGRTMFMPAAGQRTSFGHLVRVGCSARYHANGVRSLNAHWVAHYPQGMECDAHNGFYVDYRNDYNNQGSACPVRCVKIVEL